MASLDPTILALLSIFGGASLTMVAGFVGAWIQGRREHQTWLRERRFEAYLAVVRLNNDITVLMQESNELHGRIQAVKQEITELLADAPPADAPDDPERLKRLKAAGVRLDAVTEGHKARKVKRQSLLDQVVDRTSAFLLLGPQSVVDKATEVLEPETDEDGLKEMTRRIRDLEQAMRTALRIGY